MNLKSENLIIIKAGESVFCIEKRWKSFIYMCLPIFHVKDNNLEVFPIYFFDFEYKKKKLVYKKKVSTSSSYY
jgi:hypothetical protein